LDLGIRLGEMISKVGEGFNTVAKEIEASIDASIFWLLY